jgi:Leucine-rich repeat (LRR) protein
MTKLEHLDLSYNEIESISERIEALKILKILNLEGNQLIYLPCSMLTKEAKSMLRVNVKNNFMHPMIWRDLATISPSVSIRILI